MADTAREPNCDGRTFLNDNDEAFEYACVEPAYPDGHIFGAHKCILASDDPVTDSEEV